MKKLFSMVQNKSSPYLLKNYGSDFHFTIIKELQKTGRFVEYLTKLLCLDWLLNQKVNTKEQCDTLNQEYKVMLNKIQFIKNELILMRKIKNKHVEDAIELISIRIFKEALQTIEKSENILEDQQIYQKINLLLYKKEISKSCFKIVFKKLQRKKKKKIISIKQDKAIQSPRQILQQRKNREFSESFFKLFFEKQVKEQKQSHQKYNRLYSSSDAQKKIRNGDELIQKVKQIKKRTFSGKVAKVNNFQRHQLDTSQQSEMIDRGQSVYTRPSFEQRFALAKQRLKSIQKKKISLRKATQIMSTIDLKKNSGFLQFINMQKNLEQSRNNESLENSKIQQLIKNFSDKQDVENQEEKVLFLKVPLKLNSSSKNKKILQQLNQRKSRLFL